MKRIIAFVACFGFLAGCAPLAVQHQADADFRAALAAQLASRTDEAEKLYHEIIALGFDWSPVWNNLAVIEVKRHEYIAARKLLHRAVQANDRDVVALTNYGVMSFYLFDFPEARRTLSDVKTLRRDILNHIPTYGRSEYLSDHWAHATAPLVEIADRYLERIDRAQMGMELPSVGDAIASLTVHTF